MNHKKLFKLSLIVAITFFCGISAKAQTWTAPTLTGSTPVSGTTYYMYNVGSGGYLSRGGWWNMLAVVSAQPRLNASTSIIKWTATNTSGSIWTFQYNLAGSNVGNNFLFAADANSADGSIYTDNSANNTWNVVQTDAINNIYSIQVVSSYGGYVSTQYLGTASATESTNTGIANPVRYNKTGGDSYTQWKFASQADMDLYNARVLLDKYMTYGKNKGLDVSSYITTYNAGVTADINTKATELLSALGRTDVTSSITNPSFESSFTGWTNGGFGTNNGNGAADMGWTKAGTYFVEKWVSGGSNLPATTLTQTVTGLSSGLYELVVSGHAVQQGGANPLHTGAFITAGSKSTEVVAGHDDYSVSNIVVAGSTLTIGYSLVAPVACNWTGFDNFRLYYYGPAAIPSIGASKTQFAFNGGDGYVSDSLTVSGANLTNSISISAPSGITVNPTSLPSGASNAKVIVTYDGSTTVSGNVTFTSGITTVNVAVTGAPGAVCFTPLYSTGNMIPDPKLNSIAGFGGWGHKAVVTGSEVYCGSSCVKFTATTNGWPDGAALDVTGIAWGANSTYRVRAMVKATDGSVAFLANGTNPNFLLQVPMTGSNWVQIDTVFTTGASPTSGFFTFNNVDGTSNGKVAYIDNYELYRLPTWTGTGVWNTPANWGGGSVPSTTADIIIMSGTLTIDANVTVHNLTIQPGAKVTLNSGNTLTVTGNLTIQSDATGTGTFVDLNPTGGFTVIGTTHVQQYLPSGRNSYISSPVSAATTAALSTATSVISYDEVHGTSAPWVTESGSLTPMKGYVSVNTTTSGVVTFSGTLNTGTQTIAPTRTAGQTKEGFNLVGNPYPSYVNWTDATKTNLLTTMWYRTKNASAYVFDTYNATGGIVISNGLTTVSNLIPPMQAFWVRVDVGQTSGTLGFTNTMRSHADVSNNSFKAPAAITQPLLRLQVSNGTNSDQAVVYFNDNASNGYDMFDSPKMMNENVSIPEIYTLAGSEQLAINGLNCVTSNQELPLGFTTGQSNTFSIKATETANFTGMNIYLRDNLLNTETELTNGGLYTFTSDATNTSSRFTIIFRSASIATGINPNANNGVWISTNANGQLVINGSITRETSIAVYNELGQKLVSKKLISATKTLENQFVPGVYMVSVTNAGKSMTTRVIIK